MAPPLFTASESCYIHYMTEPLTPDSSALEAEALKKKAKKEAKARKASLDQEKTFLAFERTLLAWIRTGTSLLTFGFAIMKLLQEESRKPGDHPLLSMINPMFIGWMMIFSGFIGLTMAVFNYVKFARQFGRRSLQIFTNPSMIVAYVLISLCAIILLAPLLRQLLL